MQRSEERAFQGENAASAKAMKQDRACRVPGRETSVTGHRESGERKVSEGGRDRMMLLS